MSHLFYQPLFSVIVFKAIIPVVFLGFSGRTTLNKISKANNGKLVLITPLYDFHRPD